MKQEVKRKLEVNRNKKVKKIDVKRNKNLKEIRSQKKNRS